MIQFPFPIFMEVTDMTIQKIRELLFKLLLILIFVSFIMVLLGEAYAPAGLLGIYTLINLLCILLAIYVYDPRIYYRRAVPLLVCLAAIMYKLFKPLLHHNRVFRKCYKIKKMSGNLADCYYDVQDVYDEYSNYNKEGAQ